MDPAQSRDIRQWPPQQGVLEDIEAIDRLYAAVDSMLADSSVVLTPDRGIRSKETIRSAHEEALGVAQTYGLEGLGVSISTIPMRPDGTCFPVDARGYPVKQDQAPCVLTYGLSVAIPIASEEKLREVLPPLFESLHQISRSWDVPLCRVEVRGRAWSLE